MNKKSSSGCGCFTGVFSFFLAIAILSGMYVLTYPSEGRSWKEILMELYQKIYPPPKTIEKTESEAAVDVPVPIVTTSRWEPKPSKPKAVVPLEEPVVVNPVPISFAGFAANRSLWPKSLKLEKPHFLQIRYNGKVLGDATVHPGAVIEITEIRADGIISGQMLNLIVSLPQQMTNFKAWAEETLAGKYFLTTYPESNRSVDTSKTFPRQQYYAAFEIWCTQKMNVLKVKIEPEQIRVAVDTLEKEDRSVYEAQALLIAQNFLLQQQIRGGDDNYATCEVVDIKTNASLARRSYFMP